MIFAQRTQINFRFMTGFPLTLAVGNQPFADDAAAQLSAAGPEGVGVDGKLRRFFPAFQLQNDRCPFDIEVFVLEVVGQPDAVSAAVGQKLAVVPCFCQNDV